MQCHDCGFWFMTANCERWSCHSAQQAKMGYLCYRCTDKPCKHVMSTIKKDTRLLRDSLFRASLVMCNTCQRPLVAPPGLEGEQCACETNPV